MYDYKLKNSKSVFIPNPYITILGGNTPTGFAQAFPTESIGQGFFSRLLLVYGEPTGVKYTFPPVPDEDTKLQLIALLHKIKANLSGEVTMSPEAMELLDSIYKNWVGIDDNRFEHYTNRRLTHLIKLALVITASKIKEQIDVSDVIEANTLLSFTEHLMPKALGEFGKSKSSEVAQKIMNALDTTSEPLSIQAIWKIVVQDLDNRGQLIEILSGLMMAEKIQPIGGNAYLPVKKVRRDSVAGSIDWSLLTENERNMI